MIRDPVRFARWWGTLVAVPVLMSVALAVAAEDPTDEHVRETAKMIVSGRVLLPAGQPAVGAQVVVAGGHRWPRRGRVWGNDAEILGVGAADDTGSFEFETRRTTSAEFFNLLALAGLDGYARGITLLDCDAQRPTAVVQLGKDHVLRATLIDLQGQPAAGAEFFVRRIGTWRWPGWMEGISFWQPPEGLSLWPRGMKSDERGRVALSGFSQGSAVEIIIDDPRFARHRILFGQSDGEAEPTVSLAPSQIVEGTVTYADTGAAAPRVRLTAGNAEAHSDERGHFRINPHDAAKMRVTAYAADGEPYLATSTAFEWPKGAASHKVEVSLSRGVLAQGRVVDQAGEPVAEAAVQYFPLRRNPNKKHSLPFGWENTVYTDARGDFSLPVLPGEGHLLVQGPHGDFIHQEIGSFVIDDDRPGGQRYYPDAVIRLDVPPDKESVRADVTLRRGVTVRGRLVGPNGEAVQRASIVSRLQLMNFKFFGTIPTELFDGNFVLRGLDPEQSLPVMFLDGDHQWGAMATISGRQAGELVTVRLTPCGTASARFLYKDGKPAGGLNLMFELIVTPGVAKFDYKEQQTGLLAMDGDFVSNLDRQHNWGVKSNDMGRILRPALIPGATYRQTVSFPDVKYEFTAESGKNIDLGDLTVSDPRE